MRLWLMNLIRDALLKCFTDLEIRLDFVRVEASAAREIAEQILVELRELDKFVRARDQELAAHGAERAAQELASAEGAQPLVQSRATWPRMKRQFEERDVRELLASQRAASDEVTSTRRAFNAEADQVANYWQQKQKGL